MNSIPIDLILEIFSRLTVKSIGRFLCVSKRWGSILCRPYLTELFLTRSSAHPHLLFAMKRHDSVEREWHFFSSPQPQNQYKKSSVVVATGCHIKCPDHMRSDFCVYESGLIYFHFTSHALLELNMICTGQRTGQRTFLHKLRTDRKTEVFLGFDPIDKIFKLLCMNYWDLEHNKILTLGTGEFRWRKIQCPLKHNPSSGKGICINGVLYYLAYQVPHDVIVCFEVRSEKFKFVNGVFVGTCWPPTLINYKGKLGVVSWNNGNPAALCMWVLEDVEKQEWSKYVYTFPEIFDRRQVTVTGVSTSGEIVLSPLYTVRSKPFYIFYFNPKRNTLQSVEIQGLENGSRVYAFVDHVEDLNVSDAKLFKSSISVPSLMNKRELSIIRKRPKPQHQEDVREREWHNMYDEGVSREKKQSEKRRRQNKTPLRDERYREPCGEYKRYRRSLE